MFNEDLRAEELVLCPIPIAGSLLLLPKDAFDVDFLWLRLKLS